MTLHIRPLDVPQQHDEQTESGARFRAYTDMRNRVMADLWGSDIMAISYEEMLGAARGTTAERQHRHIAMLGDAVVGAARVDVSLHELDAPAYAYVCVDPGHRQRGIGAALAEHADQLLSREGRSHTQIWAEHPSAPGERLAPSTGVGSVPSETAITRMLLRCGFTLEQVERVSMLDLTGADHSALERLRDAAAERAQGYTLRAWSGRTPLELLQTVAALQSRMSTDAPAGGLEVTPEHWTPERLIEWENRQIDKLGHEVRKTVAFSSDGEAVAFTVLTMGPSSRLVYQEDTLVHGEHRGHRLGALVKVENLLALLRDNADRDAVVTWNAEENRHMLDINESMGFEPVLYEGAWQRREASK